MNNKIKELRARHNITQAQLAEAVGISRAGLIDIEKGEAVPAGTTMLKIANYFELPAQEVFSLEEKTEE